MIDQKLFGDILKDLREQKNVTQEMLAERCRVSRQTVRRWEQGVRMPELAMYEELCAALDVSPTYFFEAARREPPLAAAEDAELPCPQEEEYVPLRKQKGKIVKCIALALVGAFLLTVWIAGAFFAWAFGQAVNRNVIGTADAVISTNTDAVAYFWVSLAASLLAFVCFVLLVWRLCAYVRDRRLRAALQTQEAPIGQENIP